VSALPGVVNGRLANFARIDRGALARVWRAIDGEGDETRLVGGAVRDLALGLPAQDFDFATTATPDRVTRRAEAAGFKVVPTGFEHGTVTIVADGRPFETTTLRQDVETDGRRAKVTFGRDFAADARRRDFTINALSLDAQGALHDAVGGLEDLARRRVRFIGDARTRVREDYLRILRFFRFSARFSEGALDAEGLSACIAEREGLAILSRERVRAETLKWLDAPLASETMTAASEAGLAQRIFASATEPQRLRRLTIIEAARGARGDALLRLAALCVRVIEDAERLRDTLRLSNAESERLEAVGRALPALHGLLKPPSLGDLRRLLFTLKRQTARDLVALVHADSGARPDDERFLSADRFLEATPEPRLPIGGAEILARGVAGGQKVGETLKTLQALWIRAGFPKEPEALARLLDQAIAETEQTRRA